MPLFHDEEIDGPEEKAPGLPAELPAGEEIVWRGSPDALGLAVHALHIRVVAVYFAALAALAAFRRILEGDGFAAAAGGAGATLLGGAAAVGILTFLAFAMSRSAIFTITTRRVIIRHGAAIKKFINLPFQQISNVSIARRGRVGDIAIDLSEQGKVPYYHLWPFARPMRINRPTPLLRSLREPETAAKALVDAMTEFAPETVNVAPGAGGAPSAQRRPAPQRAPASAPQAVTQGAV